MHLLTVLIIIETIIAGLSDLNYLWPQYNDQFDCIVGISVDNNPVSVGVFISTKTVLTSANPLNHVGKNTKRVRIHSVKGYYNETNAMKISKISNDQSQRKKYWIPMGIEATEHTTIHDIALITISEQIMKIPTIKQLRSRKDKGRRPYSISLPNITHYQLPMEFLFAGFGYLDQEHVLNNTFLEVSYSSELITNCDEWIPREWGRFICILDDRNSHSLPSGAPLFEDGDMSTVYGIGCFSLKKGKDNLHVFTDLKPYVGKLDGYTEDKEDM